MSMSSKPGEPTEPTRPPSPPFSLSLTKFADRLALPPVLRPAHSRRGADGYASLRVQMRSAQVRLHSQLPPTEVWAYEGHLPGPTIEVRRGQRVQIEWVNAIQADAPYPVTAVTAPDPEVGTPPEQIPQNQPGRSGGRVNDVLARVPPWAVVHVHGGRIAAVYDGWTENGFLSEQAFLGRYENDQRATLLWYHDHAMGITRFNVYAGLAGLYLIRDDEEDALGLPRGPYELPLLLQDRNLDTDAAGRLTGRLLHKVEVGTMEFFGPFTLVNGTIWPYADVEARQYRLRLLNGANARTFRLVLLDAAGRPVRPDAIRQIGTDGGLLGAPVALPPDGLVLAPAERADLLVDFRPYRGQRLRLVNTAGAPFDGLPPLPTLPPGTPDPANRLADADVLQFRVTSDSVDDDPFVLSATLSSTYRRLTNEQVPTGAVRRIVALVEESGMLMLHELAPAPQGAAAPDEPLISVTDDNGVTTPYRVVAKHFEDTVNWFVAYGATEVWQFLNLTEDTHPMHVHLVQFQALRRDRYNTDGYDAASGRTTAPVTFEAHGTLDANELGWKDTVRVNPGELVAIAATFEGYTGRYMYHCHILEHEDHDMMRPFIVMPAAALAAMDMPDMQM
ncbi:MAG TPA: multicopper oxidase family protein [Ktedonobacterales bacterium]|nr:multicopper oxidase family protein [Ktedonobacterales bacterium]